MYQLMILTDAQEYLDGLQPKHRAKAEWTMGRLQAEGPMLHRPHADAVRGKIRELRCSIGTFEHRFLFFFDGSFVVLTHGFLKKEDSIREGEIRRAERLMEAYMAGKNR
jgi:phage-related protein